MKSLFYRNNFSKFSFNKLNSNNLKEFSTLFSLPKRQFVNSKISISSNTKLFFPQKSSSVYKTPVKTYFSYPCPRNLREIVKMSMIEQESPVGIKQIWERYHLEKQNVISDVVDGDLMAKIIQK